MFGIIRCFIGAFVAGAGLLMLRKLHFPHKKTAWALSIGTFAVLTAALSFWPFENLFYTFDSPEAAYAYGCFGAPDIELVVPGNQCDWVIDRRVSSRRYQMVPKTEEGWKVGLGADTRRVEEIISDGVTVEIYRYRDTDDYFIAVLDTAGGKSDVADSLHSDFRCLEERQETLPKSFFTYYAYIPRLDVSYRITVNGRSIAVGESGNAAG